MKLTKIAFFISDLLALTIGIIAIGMAAVFPMAMDYEDPAAPLTTQDKILWLIACLLVIAGAFQQLRRKPVGLLLLLSPAALWLLNKPLSFIISYLIFCLLIFGLPYALAFYELKAGKNTTS